MRYHEPRISEFLVPCPASIGAEASAAQALFVMRRIGTRYLPVKAKGKIVGLLKEDRVKAAAADKSTRHLAVRNLMGSRPEIVPDSTSLFHVLDETPHSTYGCTVVQGKDGKVVGVFSPLDAVVAYRQLRKQDAIEPVLSRTA